MNRLAAVIISIVFIFTACGRHAVEREVFSTAETGNEVFETEEREQARNEKPSWTTGLCYAEAAIGVIAAAAATAAVIYKYCCNITTYPVVLKLNEAMLNDEIWERFFNSLDGIKGKDEGEVFINFRIESDNAEPIECVFQAVKYLRGIKYSRDNFCLFVRLKTDRKRKIIGIMANGKRPFDYPTTFQSRTKLGENPRITLEPDNEFIRELIQIVPEGEAAELVF